MLELIVSDRAGYMRFISGNRGKNRGSVIMRRTRKRGFNRGGGGSRADDVVEKVGKNQWDWTQSRGIHLEFQHRDY